MTPESEHQPTFSAKTPEVALVAPAVPFDFFSPVIRELLSPVREPPTVPEVAINEHHYLRSNKHEVRFAWQAREAAPVSQSSSVQGRAHRPL